MIQRGTVLDSGVSQASFLMQAFTLTKRSFVNMSRDSGYYWLRLAIYIVVTICIGTIYLNVVGTSYTSILLLALKNRDTNEAGAKCIKKEAKGSWSSHSKAVTTCSLHPLGLHA
ncbi:hypothetical protein ACB092_04G045200 [Castanea dentata]